jgi:hypothetical protein
MKILSFKRNNFSISQNDDLKIGDKVTVSHYGISKEYYNYIILVSISGGNVVVLFNLLLLLLGNIINTTNADNYPLGYFSLVKLTHEIIPYNNNIPYWC